MVVGVQHSGEHGEIMNKDLRVCTCVEQVALEERWRVYRFDVKPFCGGKTVSPDRGWYVTQTGNSPKQDFGMFGTEQ